tara:strand:- start:498 stop:803 length:306 start_codon:yes stop_codon:yes gene_type:complete
MSHRGIRQYAGDETGNVGLGQLGFKVISSAGNSGDGNFAMIKVIGGAADVHVDIALVTHLGDDVTINDVVTGELLYGPFKKITTTNHDADIDVLCYYGNPI